MAQETTSNRKLRPNSAQETEIRLILARGHQRLRAMHNQGYRLSGVERILNLMRDLRIVPLNNVIIKIPLVYAAEWRNKGNDLGYSMRPRKNFITSFARAEQFSDGIDQAEMQVHRLLVSALRKYLSEYKTAEHKSDGFLFDVYGFHQEPLIKYNSEAYYGKAPHPLFKNVNGGLPKVLKEVHALIRITFALDKQSSLTHSKTGAIIMGIVLQSPSPGAWNGNDSPPKEVFEQLKGMADILVREIPEIHDQLKVSGTVVPVGSYASGSLEEVESDELHAAVDELHAQIANLAARLGLPEWHTLQPPRSGYNFLVAFRQLDSDLQGCLRYCLTTFNQKALRENIISGDLLNRERYSGLAASLSQLFSHDAQLGKDFFERCWGAINETLQDKGHGDALRELKRRVESSPYPLHLTPGYSVMTRGYPEVVKDWLADPRARNFEKYPPLLLAWESLALPEGAETYYSPIADGNIKFAICGVGAELLYKGGGFELQELIDNSGSRLRDIICNNLIVELKKDLFGARVHGTSGYDLWKKAWFHFRQLAYYYLPDRHDYFTMLAEDDALKPFEDELRATGKLWRQGQTMSWWFLQGQLDERLVSILRSMPNHHTTQKEASPHEKYLKQYIETDRDLRRARLYKIKLRNASTLSMLVLVPSPENHQRATSLLSRFTIACGDALSFYNEEARIVVSSSEFGHQSVYLLKMLGSGLSRMVCCPLLQIRLVTEVLQNEVDYYGNRIENITSGPSITVAELFALLFEIMRAIEWGLEATMNDVKGSLSGISPSKINILEDSLNAVKGTKIYAQLAGRKLGISRRAALFLMWEIAINLCKHAKSKIKFVVRTSGRSGTLLRIESDRQESPIKLTGRYGIQHLQRVAKLIGVDFDSGPINDNLNTFRQCITFDNGGRR